ncbi:B-cell receptor-associated protein 31-like-domain-containing protein [Lipomyces kononenkoae]|uniref:B-cell receptor-associated protein 31-like-domain-containing protein n=1 Tax=Lipomyces kononenkoae TaxID=34357 RepID=A0ACC3T1Z5_LIPKO
MTLYYTLVFVILMVEMVSFFFLVTPLPFNFRRRLFHFISTSDIIARTQHTLKIVFVFILILFIDSVNRVYRVQQDVSASGSTGTVITTGADRTEIQARKFYSQRNMYLCGFTLFLSIILNRTYVLIVDLLATEDKLTTLKKSAVSASAIASKDEEIAALKAELKTKDVDLETLRKQCEGLSAEYHKLGDQLNALESAGSDTPKKDM